MHSLLWLLQAPHWSITAAWGFFIASYVVFAFGRLPGTRLDRTAAAVIGAVGMAACRVLTAQQAIASVDFATIVLLFSMMLIVAGLHLSGFFHDVVNLIADGVDGRWLLPGIIFSSGILSAFLVNDVVCLFMAPMVLRLARKLQRPATPLLLALATASNIGSAATITGNPQNILIGSLSGIGYLSFLARLGPPALIGLFIDWGLIYWLTRNEHAAYVPPRVEPEQDTVAGHYPEHRRWAVGVALLVVIGFLCGGAPPFVAAIGGALILLAPGIDREKLFGEVDWSLLVLFTGLFIILGGAEHSGIAQELLSVAERGNLHQPAIFTVAVTALSNIVSNVPAVMLLKGIIPSMGDPRSSWMLLALTSTLAGNLTITGSVANIIVVEKARQEAPIGFFKYMRIGVPV
ncbi:MAG TPA: anion transporter, partial [Terriglobales bacterium]